MSRRVVYLTVFQCVDAELWPDRSGVHGGKPILGLSQTGAMLSSAIYRDRWTAHSSLC